MFDNDDLFINTNIIFSLSILSISKKDRIIRIIAIQLKDFGVYDKSNVAWLTCKEHTTKLTFYKIRFRFSDVNWVLYRYNSNFSLTNEYNES